MTDAAKGGAYGIGRRETLATGGQVLVQKVNCVVHDNSEGDGDHHGAGKTHVPHQVAPQAEAHGGGNEIGHETDQTEAYALEDPDQDQ